MINYRKIAILVVKNYLKTNELDTEIEAKYGVVLDLIEENYRNYRERTNGLNINSINEGLQSISFNNTNLITSDIKALLPQPTNIYAW